LRWVGLTTRKGGDAAKLAQNHWRLRKWIEKTLGFEGLQYVQVSTSEGGGVLHIVWAWRGERSFYIPQHKLSAAWGRIHGAPIVWISAMGTTRKDCKNTARYMITQYCVEQDGFKRLSYSWDRLPLKMFQAWETLKEQGRETYVEDGRGGPDSRRGRVHVCYTLTMAEIVAAWEQLLERGRCMLGRAWWAVNPETRELVEIVPF
jgi:hypothetical protein